VTRRARSELRIQIDAARARVWFHWLQMASGHASAYALEKRLMPNSFARTDNGVLSHRNRMSRYARGMHIPHPRLVARAEQLFPGGRALLEHPLWQILDPSQDAAIQRAHWLKAMCPDVQRIWLRARSGSTDRVRARATPSLVKHLERVGNVDALASILLLLREALVDGDAEFSYRCAQGAWRVLLMMGASLPFFMVLPDLAKLTGASILDRVTYQGEKVAISKAPIMMCVDILRRHCLRLEDAGKLGLDDGSWICECLHVFSGDRGFDLLFALSMPTVATPELEADAAKYSKFLDFAVIRENALRHVCDARLSKRRFEDDFGALA